MTFNKDLEFILRKFSHELRNPLTAAYSTLQLIQYQHPEVKDYKHWSALTHDLEYMNELLTELSDFAKSDQLRLSTFSFRNLLKEVVLTFASSIEHSEVEFTSKIHPSIHQITGDRTKLQEVFLNLLKNSYDACLPKGSIYLEAFSEGDFVTIVIEDNGSGIDDSIRTKVFDPYFTTKENGKGSGLGLPICKRIVNAHGGVISIDSYFQKETIATVHLPLRQK